MERSLGWLQTKNRTTIDRVVFQTTMSEKSRAPISIRIPESEEILIRQAAKSEGVTLTEIIMSNFRKSFYEEKQAS